MALFFPVVDFNGSLLEIKEFPSSVGFTGIPPQQEQTRGQEPSLRCGLKDTGLPLIAKPSSRNSTRLGAPGSQSRHSTEHKQFSSVRILPVRQLNFKPCSQIG